MGKIHWSQWMGLVPFVLLIGLLIFGYLITGITVILNLIFVSILLLFYILTYTFGSQIFEFGERSLIDDVELINLEKDNAAILWAFASGVALAFLIPGMLEFSKNSLMAIIGLVLLSVGNLIYQMFYYPRYAFLVRKRKIALSLAKRKSQ